MDTKFKEIPNQILSNIFKSLYDPSQAFIDYGDIVPFIEYFDSNLAQNSLLFFKKNYNAKGENYIKELISQSNSKSFYDISDTLWGLLFSIRFIDKDLSPFVNNLIKFGTNNFLRYNKEIGISDSALYSKLNINKLLNLNMFSEIIQEFNLITDSILFNEEIKLLNQFFFSEIMKKGFLSNYFYINNKFFYKIFDQFTNGSLSKFRSHKDYLTLFYGFNDKQLKLAIEKHLNWLDNLQLIHHKKLDSRLISTNITSKKRSEIACDLTVFQIIEILLESYIRLDEKKYLELAKSQIKSVFLYQDNCGLIPFEFQSSKASRFKTNFKKLSWLDSSIDFLVVCYKLLYLVKEDIDFYEEYLFKVNNLYSAIYEYHFINKRFYTTVNVSNQKIFDDREISLKRSLLGLKGLLAKDLFDNNMIRHCWDKSRKEFYYLADR